MDGPEAAPHSDGLQQTQRSSGSLDPRKLRLFVIIVATLCCVTFLGVLVYWHAQFNISSGIRAFVMFAIAIATIAIASRAFFLEHNDPTIVRYAIVFNTVVFITIGVTAVVLICKNWQVAILLSGSSLLIGGFVGLLFGYPQGVAQQNDSPKRSNAAIQPNTPTTPRYKNLVAESAATLGKLLAGFTLAKVGTAYSHFATVAKEIGPALDAGSDAHASAVIAGLMMIYFCTVGFLAGILLPPYFMSDTI